MRRWVFLPVMPVFLPLVAGAGSLLLLAGAYGSEHFGGLAPCALCLEQRLVHWGAATLALLMAGLQWRDRAKKMLLPMALGLAAIYVYSAGLAAYHAGIEWQWWQGPAACSGQAIITSADDLLAGLETASGGPSCAAAPFRFLGLSMAGYNSLFSVVLACVIGLYGAGLTSAHSEKWNR